MQTFGKWLGRLLMLIVVGLAAGYLYLVMSPPELLRVGAGYSAKITCSAALIAGRDPAQVLERDVQAPGNPLLKGYALATDRAQGLVHSGFLRFIAPVDAVLRPGLGCALAPDGKDARVRDQTAPPAPGPSTSTALWPAGEGVDLSGHDALAAILADDQLAGPGMRGIVVVQNGRIVAERYAPGFDASTPQLGWSMTKTVTAALVGTLVDSGKLQMDQDHLLPQWAADDRAKITVADLMSMSSGLHFNEDYGDVSDVTRMLFLEPDMAGFVASQALDHPPGTHYSYSTGTAVLMSRIWQNALGDTATALAWPRKALFDPLGMGSAVLETDEAGTFVGGSYLYATPRDWARFGLMLLQDGAWDGQQVLSPEFARLMHTPSKAEPGYGQGMMWMDGPSSGFTPGADVAAGIPDDAYWMEGHDGQTVTIIPSANAVVVRMGLTPGRLDYKPQPLVAAILKALAPS
ncbi:MAG: serine hydrolase [Limimaricola sp.]|uniref:serine hydrolase domain-containing protein n=1 Tax=Limimaricola sp. TaxID=2211665 RepID=UPI001DFEA04A|nr:serine hydrolase [Limimaricola sp.]MBI1418875.1 serine hydrolase [Limimaricola sp.]